VPGRAARPETAAATSPSSDAGGGPVQDGDREGATIAALRRIYRHALLHGGAHPEAILRARRLEWFLRLGCQAERVSTRVEQARRQGNLTYFEWLIHDARLHLFHEYLILHSAAVAGAGGCLLLPGPSGCGKTTLSARLLARGLGYLSDEQVDLDPLTQEALPFPKALTVKPGSFALFAGVQACATFAAGSWAVKYVDPESLVPGCVWRSRARVDLIVFPGFVPAATTVVARVDPPATVERLFTHSANLAHHKERGLDAFVALARRVPVYSLTFGDVDDACDAVLDLVEPLS